ncbi:hypothetical protein TrRE_jg10031 [Triparma retinervis]|uniref:Uncharacterized protein n=1 Tax=Triparma retinervis TaxID=2557542 RepID=A0A9W6ZLX0_9STRA|nr:hypothetical protein TrRE_jg10031 [Triparma retinervis]
MEEEEQLSLKLISKLEQLESENNRLHQQVHDNEQRESLLESKISAMDAQLEDAMADIINLEKSQLSQTGRKRANEIYESTKVPSTPNLLPQSQIYGISTRSPIRMESQLDTPPPQTSKNTPPPSQFKPWESGGIKTQISDFMNRMEELEKENDSLKHINRQLQNLNVMQQSKARESQGMQELEVTALYAEKRAADLETDMAVLIANQQALLTTFEQKSSSLARVTQEYKAYKAKRQMELRNFEMRLSDVVADFKKAESSLQIAEEKRKGDEETMAQSQRVISTMQKELQRKNEAIQQMRAHTSSISENYNAMNEKFKSEQRSVKLEIASIRAEGKEKDTQIARLLAETGDLLMLKQQKVELKQNCHDLLSVVESQQEMIQSLRDESGTTEPDFQPVQSSDVLSPKPLRPNKNIVTAAGTFAARRIEAPNGTNN